MRVLLILCILSFLTILSPAQDLGIFEEISAGSFSGIGARQMAMGGSGIANSIDGSAIWYNPAALAQIHRVEFQLGMTHQKFTNETSQRPGRYDPANFNSTLNFADIDATKSRFSTANLAIPIPTFRGSLVVAVGVNRIVNFDRKSIFNVRDIRISDNALVDDLATENEKGSIYLYSGAAAIDLTPKLSVGGALNVFSGKSDFIYSYRWIDETLDPSSGGFTNPVNEDYIGVGAKGGLLYRPDNRTTFGITLETPIYWEVEQTFWDDGNEIKARYDLIHPFKLGAGVSIRGKQFRITGEAQYVDWSQMEYSDNIDMEFGNDSLSVLYRDVINLRAGIEYEMPRSGLAFRAGIFSQPLPYDDKFIIDDRIGYTAGIGWLVDKALLLEAAYVNEGLKRTYTAVNGDYTVSDNAMAIAEDRNERLYLTLSYRY